MMSKWKKADGSTGQLIQLCIGYFIFYVITGVAVKYFTGSGASLPHVSQMEYLVYNTLGGIVICVIAVILMGWYKLKSNNFIKLGKAKFPAELCYIIPSGICTAIVVPTTTLMYLLPISVMVAMVIMRGSIIIISRLIDAIQIKQGILQKKVFWEEEVAVVFAVLAISSDIFFGAKSGGFDFLHSPAALCILGSYITAYFIRIYIMNYYKNTRGKGIPQDTKGFFAIEQLTSAFFLVVIAWFVFAHFKNTDLTALVQFNQAIATPTMHWSWEALAGLAYGVAAFFSVFLFMFKGRTATFAGLVNRLTSLVAGTVATLLFALWFNGKFPSYAEWFSLLLIFVAVKFLTQAEKRRSKELKKTVKEESIPLIMDLDQQKNTV